MIRRLIIFLLIVGCDNSTEPTNTCDDGVCEVEWLLMNVAPSSNQIMLYYTSETCDVCFVGFTSDDEKVDDYVIVEGDTIDAEPQKLNSILHYSSPNYFTLNGASEKLYAVDYETCKYEYK